MNIKIKTEIEKRIFFLKEQENIVIMKINNYLKYPHKQLAQEAAYLDIIRACVGELELIYKKL